ncbi:MAG TPA: DUF2723 domain-containing protein [Tepidisphaeraceae bacterium]|nr:DUF2723 domain-containing protein [Tepidisphaeraceae bacterium]
MIEPWMAALGTGLVSLAVYVRTMCRTIYVGDSGELAAAVHVAGIPHPPGYPIYVLLGKLFSILVPFGKPAFRINLFSSFCSAIATAFLTLTIALLGFDPWFSSAIALCFAFSASLWSQSGITRVYALGACLSSLATFFFVKWVVNPTQTGWLMAAGLMIGFGMANHPVAGVHIPAMLAAAAVHHWQAFTDPVVLILSAASVLPGILLYFTWIPFRARTKPPVNWGNIQNGKDLWKFLSRKDYWKHRWVMDVHDAITVIMFYVRRVGTEYGFLGSSAIVIGWPIIFMQSRAMGTMAAVLIVLNTASMIAHARREDIFHWTRYMITSWYALAFPLAYGWFLMLLAVPFAARPYASFLPALLLLLTQFRKQDLSRHRYADEYSRRILECLPENATLIAQDDNVVFPLMYLRYAENIRTDIKLLEQGVHQLAELRFNPKRDAVFCTHWQQAFNQPATPRGPGLRLVAEGLIYRVISTDMMFQPRDLWESHMLPNMEDPRIPRNYLARCLLGHVYFMRGEWEVVRNAVTAAAWYDRAARMAYDNAVLQFNLGLTYDRHGWKQLSDDAFTRAEAIDRKYPHPRKVKPVPSDMTPGSALQSSSPNTGSRS